MNLPDVSACTSCRDQNAPIYISKSGTSECSTPDCITLVDEESSQHPNSPTLHPIDIASLLL